VVEVGGNVVDVVEVEVVEVVVDVLVVVEVVEHDPIELITPVPNLTLNQSTPFE
jgi:hypothetical protein